MFSPINDGDLQKNLKEITSFGENDTVCINLLNKEYKLSFIESNSKVFPYDIRCNIEITGKENAQTGEMSTISFLSSIPDTDDALLLFNRSNDVSKGGRVVLKNLKLTISDLDSIDSEKIMLKFVKRSGVEIQNVIVSHSLNKMTNIDMRDCSDVDISNCKFITYNCLSKDCQNKNPDEYHGVGGCLWIRGESKNFNIRGNKFYKAGNDECMAIWNMSAENVCNIQNISIKENEIQYGGIGEPCTNDVLIAFYSLNSADNRVNFKDIEFCDNKIVLNDYCSRVIKFSKSSFDNIERVKFQNNKILHDYETNVPKHNYVSDFYLINREYSEVLTAVSDMPIEISNNIIQASEILQGGGNGHTVLECYGGKILFENNVVDGTAFRISNPASWQNNRGWLLMMMNSGNGDYEINNNRFSGLGMQTSTPGNIDNIKLTVRNNYFDGNIKNYWPKVGNINYIFLNNDCENTGYYVLFQDFGRGSKSSAYVAENIFKKEKGTAHEASILVNHRKELPCKIIYCQ